VTAAADDEPRRVMEPAQAYLMTSLLQGVITSGTAAAARNMGVTGDVAGDWGVVRQRGCDAGSGISGGCQL